MPAEPPPLAARLRREAAVRLARVPALRERALGRRSATWFRRAGRGFKETFGWLAGAGVVGVLGLADLPAPAAHRFLLAAAFFWGALFVRARLAGFLEKDPDLLALALLPVSDDSIFRRQLRRALLHLSPVPMAGLVAGGLIAAAVGEGSRWPLGLVGGLLLGTYLVMLGLAFLPWRSAAAFSSLGWVLLFPGVLVVRALPGPWRTWMLEALGRHGDVLATLLPTGWAIEPLHHGLAGTATPLDGAWALPIAALLLATPVLVRRYRDQYLARESVLLHYAAQAPEWFDDDQQEELQEALERPRQTGLTELRERVLDGHFLESNLSPTPGWIERWVWSFWTLRERQIAEWALGAWPAWTRSWTRSWAALGATCLATAMLRWIGLEWAWVAPLIGCSLVGLQVLPVGSGLTERALAPVQLGQARITPLALFPVTLGELIWLGTKASAVRGVAALPFGLLTGALGVWFFADPARLSALGASLGAGASIGAQVCVLTVAVRPLLMVWRASQATADTARFRWNSLKVALLHLTGALGGLALTLVSLVPFVGWAALVVLGLFSAAVTALYLRHWNRGAFDLQQAA